MELIAVHSPRPDSTVALFAQGHLHLWRQRRASVIMALTHDAHRAELARDDSSAAAAADAEEARAHRARLQIGVLLSVAVAVVGIAAVALAPPSSRRLRLSMVERMRAPK